MRLIFCHIPKTAGTSVRENLAAELERDGIKCVNAYRAAGVPPDAFPDYQLPGDWKYLSGHVPMRYLTENPQIDVEAKDLLFLTVIRDPIDRLISWYNYVALNPAHQLHEQVRASDGIEYVRSMEANAQTGFLKPHDGTVPKWRYIIASIDNIEPTSAEIVKIMVQRDVPKQVFERKRNMTKDRHADFPDFTPLSKDDFPDQLLKELHRKHAEDMALYETVRKAGHLDYLPVS